MAEPTAVQKRSLAKMGFAMPDGSYYIRAGAVGDSDLQNAIDAVGRGEPQSSHNAIRVHIMKRAKALGLSDKIPDNWQSDGSLKQGDLLDQRINDHLEHFGITGMRWGHHLPGTEALGGPGNSDGANGPSPTTGLGKRGPNPFIQRGDHTGDRPGESGPADHSGKPPEHQAQEAIDYLKALHDRVTQATASAKAEADGTAPTDLTKEQAAAVHEASAKHKAQVAQIHNKATAEAAKHKTAQAKIAKHPNKTQAKRASAAAAKLHAAHMHHLAKTAHHAHVAHKAHVSKLKVKSKVSELTKQDKAELAKLSPSQRSALKKLTPHQRATLNKMTPAQRAKLSHLTQAEKTALSHLSSKQKAALAKATAASAKKRHEAALARKAAGKKIVTNPSTAAAKKQTAAAQERRTVAQRVAIAKLRSNAQNGSLRQGMDDPVGTFLEHFGVKGMHWGVRRSPEHQAERLSRRIAKTRANIKHHETAIENIKSHIADAEKNGSDAELFKKNYGVHSNAVFQAIHGKSRSQLLEEHKSILHKVMEDHHKPALHALKGHLASLERKQAKAQHDDFDEVGEFLEHFGVKGMKWGIRRNGGHPGREPHPVSSDSARAAKTAQTIKKHGIGSVSNEDLRHLVSRQNLINQHAGLNETGNKKLVDKMVADLQRQGQQEASKLLAEYAAKGAVVVGKHVTRQLLGTSSGAGRHS